MANKNFNIGLIFNANTSQAKAQVKDLRTNINNLLNQTSQAMNLSGWNKELDKVRNTVKDLKLNLDLATNVDTGRIDMTKFNANLKRSGLTIKDYRLSLSQLGAEGRQAFSQLTQSILQAEMPVRKTSGIIDKMWGSLKNVATWQMSSTALNSITQVFSEAFQYVQDLNKGLNDIRIVTGYSADEMERFAVAANNAAKGLSTTTNEYVKASLIYFQQGLNDKEVKERTDATIKLANVTGESAETVSEWMTAIWNNFDDGSKSLEHYADVLTKLGAATASSSDEIAGGLEKFAAIADTVGLSYEYAATALATITAQTRQSEDVVGTGLRTIFSRLQSLSLGEALEDGTDLTKYSQALETVGINIKTASGDLRDMDDILNDLGARWEQLGRAEQNALAQTVGGVRQYTNLIALMDNWDVFKDNLALAENSMGELNKQNEIYAESWEAASNRVKSASEDLYSSLVDDDFFIGLTNGFADVLDKVDDFIEAIGGLRTLIPLIGGLLIKNFGPMAMSSITSFVQGARGLSEKEIDESFSTRRAVIRENSKMWSQTGTTTGDASSNSYVEQEKVLNRVEAINRRLANQEKDRLQYILRQHDALAQEVRSQAEVVEQAQEEVEAAQKALEIQRKLAENKKEMASGLINSWLGQGTYEALGDTDKAALNTAMTDEAKKIRQAGQAQASLEEIKDMDYETYSIEKTDFVNTIQSIPDAYSDLNMSDDLKNKLSSFDGTKESFIELQQILKDVDLVTDQVEQSTKNLIGTFEQFNGNSEEVESSIKEVTQEFKKEADAIVSVQKKQNAVANGVMVLGKRQTALASNTKKTVDALATMAKVPLGETIMSCVGSMGMLASSMSMVGSSVNTLIEGFKNGNMTFSTFLSSISTMLIAFPMLIGGLKSLGNAFVQTAVGQTVLNTAITNGNAQRKLAILLNQTEDKEKLKSILMTQLKMTSEEAENAIKEHGNGVTWASIIANKAKTLVDAAETTTVWGKVAAKTAELLVTLGLNAATASAIALALTFIATIAIVAVVIVGLVKVIKFLSDTYNQDAIAAEKATKAYEQQVKALSEVKQAYDDLKSSIDKYDEAQRNIDTMIEGTDEWRNAVTELNAQVIDLINKYPELAQYIDNVNGRLVIREQGTKKLLEEEEKELALSQAMVYSSQVNMNEANMKAQRTQKARDEVGMNMGAGSMTGTLLGVGAATAIATAINPLLGAIVGLGMWAAGSIEMAENQKDESDYKEAFGALSSEYAKKGEEMFTEDWDSKIDQLVGSNKEVAKSLKEDKEAIQESIRQQKALEESNRLLREQIANQVNKNDKRYQDGDFQALYDYVGGQKQADEQTIANKTKEFTDLGAREATEKYLELTYGKDWASKYRVQNWAGKGVTIQIKTEDGGWKNLNDGEKDSWDWKELAKQAASLEVADLTEEDYEAIDKEAGGYAKVLKKYKSDELDETDIQGIASDIYKIQHGENLTIDLTKYFSTSQEVEDFMKSIPQGSNNPVYQALQKAYEGYDEALRNSKLQNSEKFDVSNYNNLKLQETLNSAEIDKEQYETYTKTLEEAYNLTEDFAKVFAETRIETTQGIIDLSEALNDNIGVLTKADKTSLAYAKALSALKASLKTMLDIELDEDVVEELFTEGVLEKALVGDTEAIAKIFKRGSEKIISELDNLDGVKDNLSNMSNLVYSSNISDGTALSNIDGLASYSNKIAEDIRNGNLEIEDAVEALNSMGFEIDKDFEAYLTGIKDNESKIKELSWDASAIKFIDRSSNFDLELIEERKKALEEEIDRYWTINQALEKQDELLNQISKISDRAFGGGKIKALQAYRGELAQSNTLLSQKLKEIQFWLSHDLQKLEELQIKIGIGIEVDESGMISNYEEVAQYLAKNGQEAVLKEFNDLKDKIADSHSEWRSVQSQIIDNNYEIEDTILEEIDVAVNFDVEAAEFALSHIERALDRIENKAFDAAAAISLMGDQLAPTMDKIEAANKGIEDIFSKNGLEKYLNDPEGFRQAIEAGKVTLNEADIEKLKEYYDTMEEGQDALLEVQSQVYDMLIQAMEEFNNKLKEQSEILEHQSSILEQYENIIDLIGKKNLGINSEILKEISQAQIDLAEGQLKAAKARRDTTQEDLATAQSLLDAEKAKGNDADPTTIKKLEETIKAAEDAAKEAETDFMTSWVNALEAAADAFEKSINRIAEEFSKSVSGIYGSIEEMRAAFDRQQEVSKRFLADYEKTYEISKLNRNITNQIDNTKNVKAQRQLAELASEINAYSIEDRQMSKIDLEYMQKKYDLMVAQIALEEAQNAKNQVRLTRDSEGNWGYVYTANESDTEKAQQNVEDKKYAMEKSMTSTEYNLTTQMIQLNEDYENELNELAEKYGTDSELFKQESEKLAQRYSEDLQYIMDEYSKLTERGAIDAQEWGLQVSTTYDQTLIHSIYPTYKNFGELQNGVTVAMESSILSLGLAYEAYYDTVQETMSNAGTSIKTFANVVSGENGTGGYLGTVKEAVEKVQQAVKTLVEQHTNAEAGFPAAENALDNWKTKWEKTAKALNQLDFTAIKTNLSSIYELYNKINSSSIKAPSTMSNYKWTEDTYTDNNGMTWRKFYNTETNEEYWIDEEKVSSYGDGSGKGQFSMSGSDMNIQIREGTIKSNDAMIDQQNKDYKPTSSSKQNYGRVSAHDTTINGVKYYAYQKVKDGELDTSSEITYLKEADAKKYASQTEEKHTRDGKGRYRNVQFATGVKTYDSAYLTNLTARPFGAKVTWKKDIYDGMGTLKMYADENGQLYWANDVDKREIDGKQYIVRKDYDYNYKGLVKDFIANDYEPIPIEKVKIYPFAGRSVDLNPGGIRFQAYEIKDKEGFKKVSNWAVHDYDLKSLTKNEPELNDIRLNESDGSIMFQIPREYGGEWFKRGDLNGYIKKFDTGGYTGDWGPEGKLAVLHQKEIILNAHDTENFLTAIQIVRSLSDKLERNALLANQGLGNIIASSNLSLGGDTLEQHVTITAEFPNVVDHNEIQEAFNTLVNQASQYANR